MQVAHDDPPVARLRAVHDETFVRVVAIGFALGRVLTAPSRRDP